MARPKGSKNAAKTAKRGRGAPVGNKNAARKTGARRRGPVDVAITLPGSPDDKVIQALDEQTAMLQGKLAGVQAARDAYMTSVGASVSSAPQPLASIPVSRRTGKPDMRSLAAREYVASHPEAFAPRAD